MLLPNPVKGWRFSGNRLLALYSFLFVTWSCILMGWLYYDVFSSLENLAKQSLMQRQQFFEQLEGDQLIEALSAGIKFDASDADTYGVFDEQKRPLNGPLQQIPARLPLDGQIHELNSCIDSASPHSRCDAVAIRTLNGHWLILAQYQGVISGVLRIILRALAWGLCLILLCGAGVWYSLRSCPLRRIRTIQTRVELIAAGYLSYRLPLSDRRDELDMLAAISNTMLDRIERFMNEIKDVCDNIAHDLRIPLTHIQAQLYRLQQQAAKCPGEAVQIDQVIAETDVLMARFNGLLRISELKDHQRRAGFVEFDPRQLVQELYDFYLPLAEQGRLTSQLQVSESLPPLIGDRALLFEALANLMSNAIKFTPKGGEVVLRAVTHAGSTRIEVLDSGPGIPPAERSVVFRRFYRADIHRQQSGLGLGLSIVAAIVTLHGFKLEVGTCEYGGARLTLDC
ncbi:sensor histidine kinase [Pseudomonas palleroniana]